MAASYQDFTGTTSKVKDFTFPYIKQSDIKVRKTTAAGVVTELVEGTLTSQRPGQYTWTNATRITINDAPVSGDTIRVYRDTASDALVGTFYPGSAIRSSDLNDNFTQNLYVTQEAEDSVDSAVTDAASAKTTATTAKATADDAADDVKRWIKDGDGTDTAGDEDDADFTARPLKPQGVPYAVARSTTAINDSATALAKALEAIDDSAAAVITADSAESAVSSVLPYTIKANAAAVQTLFGGSDSPTADDIFEMTATDDLPVKILSAAWASGTTYKVNDQRTNDSGKLYLCTGAGTSAGSGGPTGEGSSITDNTVTWKYIAATNGIWTISGVPDPLPTFSTGITVKLKYASGDASASSWSWQSYHANNPETIYAATASPAFTGTPTAPTAGSSTNTTQIATTAFVHGGYQPLDADLTSLSSCQSGGAAALAALTSTEIEILDGATVSTTELNILDGVTSTTSELNILDGVTSTATELNLLDGKTVVGDAVLASDQTWTGSQRGDVEDVGTKTAAFDFDLNTANNFKITINGTFELGFSNRTEGQSGTIEVVNGAFTPSWGTECHFVGGTVIDLTQSATSYLAYYCPSTSVVVVNELLDVKAQS